LIPYGQGGQWAVASHSFSYQAGQALTIYRHEVELAEHEDLRLERVVRRYGADEVSRKVGVLPASGLDSRGWLTTIRRPRHRDQTRSALHCFLLSGLFHPCHV
jgi:hypothetical protein